MFMPRTIDKLRALIPGGDPGVYFINGKVAGISGYLLQQLGITQDELQAVVTEAVDEDEVAAWLRAHADVSIYPKINATLISIKPHHVTDPQYFQSLYGATLEAHPDLQTILDIIEADDRRLFG